VLPKDYQNEERKIVQEQIMDQTNNIVNLFENIQKKNSRKSPEMAFLKQASKLTGTGPWSVTKDKQRRNQISRSPKKEIIENDQRGHAIVPADYLDLEQNHIDKQFSNEKQAVEGLYDSLLDGTNDGRYAENTFVDRLVKLTNTPWGLSKGSSSFKRSTDFEQDNRYDSTDTMLPKGYLRNEEDRLRGQIDHEENRMQGLFDDVTHDNTEKDEKAEDRFIDRMSKLADTPWGLSKRRRESIPATRIRMKANKRSLLDDDELEEDNEKVAEKNK